MCGASASRTTTCMVQPLLKPAASTAWNVTGCSPTANTELDKPPPVWLTVAPQLSLAVAIANVVSRPHTPRSLAALMFAGHAAIVLVHGTVYWMVLTDHRRLGVVHLHREGACSIVGINVHCGKSLPHPQ